MKALLSHQFMCAVLSVTALSSAPPPQNKSPDEIALIAQISSYYAAYSKKDLGALLMFWSHRSPDLPAGIEEAQHALVGGVYGVSEVSVSQIKIADNKAILQASAVFASSDEQARVMRREKRVRHFALIKEGGEWKLWRDADNAQDLSAFLEKGSEWQVSADSLEQFAVALVNASEAEREHLLADNQKMITTDLRNALTRKVGPLQVPGSYDRAVSLLRLIENIADRLGDNDTIAMAERQIGDVFREWGRWGEALKQYQEAAAIYEAMGRRSSMAATITSIAQASESVAKQQSGKFSRIHFAAPALLNDASPLYSHIALAQSEGYGNDDGLLEVWELMRMNLRIDLLALSTSQPAQERMSSGEGFIGWSWGSFVAGCPTTVLSQWKVTSPSTTELVLEFHQNLKSHDSDTAVGSSNKSRKAVEARQSRFGINAAQALRGAMLKLLSGRRYRHPYYWAGFEVMGNGR